MRQVEAMANKGSAPGPVCCRLALLLVTVATASGCECPGASVLTRKPPAPPAGACCLNLSGSSLSGTPWPALPNLTGLRVLDLSHCGLSGAELGGAASLRELHLQNNSLAALPGGFLSGLPRLRLLDLRGNRLQRLPEDFLRGSEDLQELDLRGNRLRSLPGPLLRRAGLRLRLGGNPWDCSCPWLGELAGAGRGNGSARLQELLGPLTCASPRGAAGRGVWAMSLGSACRPPDPTVFLIILPLLIASLLLCWCCIKRRRRRKSSGCHSNGHKPPADPGKAAGPRDGPAVLQNQLLLRPSSALLGSTRDLYEEVEVRPPPSPRASPPSSSSGGMRGPGGGGGSVELDAVSVTDVLKDSADREKAYLRQPSQFYSLVPGLQLEDSDQGEYESVDLS